MKDLKAIRGKFYIRQLIEDGEHEHQDFKFAITDARKIARSISAFANNDGGRLLIGVKDNGNIAGIRNEEDIFVIEQAAQMYCRPPQDLQITAFKVDGGAIVVRAEIKKAESRPVKCQEPDGSWRAYYRVKDENILAPQLLIKAWQRAESQTGEIITMSDAENTLMQLLNDSEGLTLEEFARSARISISSAEQIILRLYSIGVITFSYNGSQFLISNLSSNKN